MSRSTSVKNLVAFFSGKKRKMFRSESWTVHAKFRDFKIFQICYFFVTQNNTNLALRFCIFIDLDIIYSLDFLRIFWNIKYRFHFFWKYRAMCSSDSIWLPVFRQVFRLWCNVSYSFGELFCMDTILDHVCPDSFDLFQHFLNY